MPDSHLSTRPLPPGVKASVIWGDAKRLDGTCRDRYLLTWRHEGRLGPMNLIIEMNPSGASEEESDQTLLKNSGFCKVWNDGNFEKGNVVPYRATKPREMMFHIDALRENRARLREAAERAVAGGGLVVVGWGSPSLPKALRRQFDAEASATYETLRAVGIVPLCLGTTRDGNPCHSLMLGYDTPLVPWAPRG